MPPASRERFLAFLRLAAESGKLIKLTLSKPAKPDSDCRNLFLRPVSLKTGPHLSLVWHHKTRDITKNLPVAEALSSVALLIGTEFLDAHLFCTAESIELRCVPGAKDSLTVRPNSATAPKASNEGHNRDKAYLIPPQSPWLRALGITNERGEPRAEMSAKFRQIQKYAELLKHLLEEAQLWRDAPDAKALRIVDMGCGKGYLTFAVAALCSHRASVSGVELRPELVLRGNELAKIHGLSNLNFVSGSIADAALEAPDVVIALHACDTATDDALGRGCAAGASLLVVSPCCHKQLRSQLSAPSVLGDALRHGIFQERQAEFVTDALRAELLEWAGYRTKVFEFISTEHTAKNLMIAAIKVRPDRDESRAPRLRELAAFYGIKSHALASQLGFVF